MPRTGRKQNITPQKNVVTMQKRCQKNLIHFCMLLIISTFVKSLFLCNFIRGLLKTGGRFKFWRENQQGYPLKQA